MRLDDIGIKTTTDKSSVHHCYCPFYEWMLARFKAKHLGIEPDLNILEIGVQFGNSIRMWREYFPGSLIVGIDSVDNGEPSKEGLDEFLLGDAYQPEMLERACEFGPYHILIDDAFHAVHHQQWFIQHYCNLLAENGLAIIEDCHGLEAIPQLASVVDQEKFYFCSVDLTFMQRNTNDSILFLLWRK